MVTAFLGNCKIIYKKLYMNGFLISSEKKFRTTQELEYLFFCRI
jgi:hypothetical protein